MTKSHIDVGEQPTRTDAVDSLPSEVWWCFPRTLEMVWMCRGDVSDLLACLVGAGTSEFTLGIHSSRVNTESIRDNTSQYCRSWKVGVPLGWLVKIVNSLYHLFCPDPQRVRVR